MDNLDFFLNICLLVVVAIACVYVINGLGRLITYMLIKKSTSAHQSVAYRNAYTKMRIPLIILYSIFIVFVYYNVIPSFLEIWHSSGPWRAKVIPIALFVFLTAIPYALLTRPVSCMTFPDFKATKYSLFLRGFKTDDYTNFHFRELLAATLHFIPIIGQVFFDQSPKKVDKKPISERALTKALKTAESPLYSIGMTKELISPEGSKRIYLDDATWQDNVLSIIQSAEYIFVLVDDREHCLWEIEQCNRHAPERTFYLVENAEIVEAVYAKMKSHTPSCLKAYLKQNQKQAVGPHTLVYNQDGETKIQYFVNTADGLKKVLPQITEAQKRKDRRIKLALLVATVLIIWCLLWLLSR